LESAGKPSADSPPAKKTSGVQIFQAPSTNYYYVNRDETDKIHNTILKLGNLNKYPVLIACTGIGGSGKTELVKNYFLQHTANYKFSAWFYAEPRYKLVSQYRQLAQILQPSNNIMALKEDDIIDIVKNWLHTQEDALLVYDNAETLDSLQDFLPSAGKPIILITSRNVLWPDCIPLSETFTFEQAKIFLEQATRLSHEGQSIRDLCNELEYFPLALSQAAGYILANHSTIEKYLFEYKKNKKLYLSNELMPPGLKKAHAPILATFKTTIEELSLKEPMAVELLKISSFFSPDFIPEDFLRIYFNYTMFSKGMNASIIGKIINSPFTYLFPYLLQYSFLMSYIQSLSTFFYLILLTLPAGIATSIGVNYLTLKLYKQYEKRFEEKILPTLSSKFEISKGLLITNSIFKKNTDGQFTLHRINTLLASMEIEAAPIEKWPPERLSEKPFYLLRLLQLTNHYYNTLKENKKLTKDLLIYMIGHFQTIEYAIIETNFKTLTMRETYAGFHVTKINYLDKNELSIFYKNFSDLFSLVGDVENSKKYRDYYEKERKSTERTANVGEIPKCLFKP
jgi:hypothetical protein